MSEGGGVKNLTARNSPDMLGEKIGMKRVPVRALKLPTTSKCIVFQGEAIRDDGKSPKSLFGVETGRKGFYSIGGNLLFGVCYWVT